MDPWDEEVCSHVCAGKKSAQKRVHQSNHGTRVSLWEIAVLGILSLVLGAAVWFVRRGGF